MPSLRKYPGELLERGVRLVFESKRPIAQVARDLGIHPEGLPMRMRQSVADTGQRTDLLTSQERDEIRRLPRKNQELRRANEILKSASVFRPRRSTRTDRREPLTRGTPQPLPGSSGSAGP